MIAVHDLSIYISDTVEIGHKGGAQVVYQT